MVHISCTKQYSSLELVLFGTHCGHVTQNESHAFYMPKVVLVANPNSVCIEKHPCGETLSSFKLWYESQILKRNYLCNQAAHWNSRHTTEHHVSRICDWEISD